MKTYLKLTLVVLVVTIFFVASVQFGRFGLIHNSLLGILISSLFMNSISNKEIEFSGKIVGVIFTIIVEMMMIIPLLDENARANFSLLVITYSISIVGILIPTLGFVKRTTT